MRQISLNGFGLTSVIDNSECLLILLVDIKDNLELTTWLNSYSI